MSFEVRPGESIVVPQDVLPFLEPSQAVGANPMHANTPKILRLLCDREQSHEPESQYRFARGETGAEGGQGFVLFVPDGLKGGQKLVITWREPNCACAV